MTAPSLELLIEGMTAPNKEKASHQKQACAHMQLAAVQHCQWRAWNCSAPGCWQRAMKGLQLAPVHELYLVLALHLYCTLFLRHAQILLLVSQRGMQGATSSLNLHASDMMQQ